MASLQRLPLPGVPFSFAPGFSSIYQFIETCSKQLCSEIKGIACKMTENTLNCWFCNVFSFQLHLCVWFYVCCNRLLFKTISILALKHTYQLRCMTMPLRILTTISHRQWQPWTAVSPLADTTGGGYAHA